MEAIHYFINNVTLYKNKDYFLKTHTGKIKFVNLDLNPSDNIEITYSYYKKRTTKKLLSVQTPLVGMI